MLLLLKVSVAGVHLETSKIQFFKNVVLLTYGVGGGGGCRCANTTDVICFLSKTEK